MVSCLALHHHQADIRLTFHQFLRCNPPLLDSCTAELEMNELLAGGDEVLLLLLLDLRISLPVRLTLGALLDTWRISPGLPRSPVTRVTATTQDIVLSPHLTSILTNCTIAREGLSADSASGDFLSDFIRED